MKIINWSISTTALLTLPLFIPATSTFAAQSSQPLSQQRSNQLAQATDDCRRVATSRTNLNVRSSPGGSIIGSLADNTLVTIENAVGDWVPISSPTQGYVSARYLKYCSQPVPPSTTASNTDNCRKVSSGNVLRVRRSPSMESPIIGTLTGGQQVTIDNRGASGWVPIDQPVAGFVSASRLTYCL